MTRPLVARLSPLFALAALVCGGAARAQGPTDAAGLAVRLSGMTALTGYESAVGDTILGLVPGAVRDRAGNVVRTGAGEPRRLAACALDEPGWVVGGIRSDGWLTLRRTPGALVPGGDQQLEGARVTVFGARGPVPGVVAVRSIHLTRQRGDAPSGPFTADSALVDLGAASAAEVVRLGVRVLSPVSLAKRPHRYGPGLLAGPWAGRRAACAALVRASGALDSAGVSVAFTVQHELGGRGLAALGRLGGPYAETLLLGVAAGPAGGLSPVEDQTPGGFPDLGRVTRILLPVRYPGAPVETVALDDVAALVEAIVAWAGGAP